MARIYCDGTYLKNNPTWHQEDSPWKARQIQRIIEKNGLAPARVCEIGCGAGGVLDRLSELYPDVEFYGYEISSQAYEMCIPKTKKNLSFRLFDLLEDDEEHFDIVMAIDVIEHIEDCFGWLRKVRDKAEYKIFHIPLDLSVQTVLRAAPIIRGRKAVGHIHYFTKETALEALKDTGYEVQDVFFTGGSVELPGRGWKKKLLRFPRKLAFSISEDLTVRILGGYSLLILAR
jgi:SAM-dependent methyltransferase